MVDPDFISRTVFRIQRETHNTFTLYLETKEDPRVIWVGKGWKHNNPNLSSMSLSRVLEWYVENFGEALYKSAYLDWQKEMDSVVHFTEVGGTLIVKRYEKDSEEIKVCGFDTFGIVDERDRVHLPRDVLAFS